MVVAVITNKNKTTKITVNEKLHDEFMQTAILIEGYTKSRKRMSIEKAMKLYINYATPYKDKRLFEVAQENKMEVWEVGHHLITMFMTLHTELDIGLDFISNEEHLKMVREHIKNHRKS